RRRRAFATRSEGTKARGGGVLSRAPVRVSVPVEERGTNRLHAALMRRRLGEPTIAVTSTVLLAAADALGAQRQVVEPHVEAGLVRPLGGGCTDRHVFR